MTYNEEKFLMADSSGGIEKLVRSHLAGFAGYSASTSPETLAGKVDVPVDDIIKLDANENPYGCSPGVKKALAGGFDMNIYPDNGQAELRGSVWSARNAGDKGLEKGDRAVVQEVEGLLLHVRSES